MKRISILASGAAFSLLAALLAQGCSSAEEDPDTSNNPNLGQGGTSAAGSGTGGTASPAAGTGGAPAGTGGTGAPAGTGGTGTPAGTGGTGTAAGTGGTGAAAPDPSALCVGSVSGGSACTVTCTDPCGVFNIGTRVCTCTNAIAACVSCGFAVADPLITPPTAAFPACVGADGVTTALDNIMEGLDQTAGYTCVADSRCQSNSDPERYCACRGNEWDCDSKPNSFNF